MSEVEDIVTEEVEVEENETHNAIVEAFDSAVAAEQSEDEIKMAMIAAGATFKNVTRLYNQFMIDAGLAISKEDRAKLVEDTLEGRDLSEEEGFDEAVAALVEAVKGATERSAAALVRSYAKKNELDVFVKPKGAGGNRTSFAGQFYEFLAGNPTMTKEEATAYIMGEGDHADTSANVQKHLSHYVGIWALVNRIATA